MSAQPLSTVTALPSAPRRPTWLGMAWRVLRRKPGRMIGFGIVVFYILMATVGPLLYPKFLPMNPADIYAPPSWAHPLGTDFQGTDVLAEIVTGSTYVLEAAFLAALCHMVIGAGLGLLAGYRRGFTDALIMRLADFILTVPGFPLLVVLSIIWNFGSPLAMGLVLGITGFGGLARAVRSQTLSIRERGYVESAKALGLSDWHVVLKEIFPNVAPYVAMNLLTSFTGSIYAQVGLFFLGVVPFSVNNWGVMLNLAFFQAGAMYTTSSLMYLLSPMAAILLLTFGVVLLLDAVDELLNPRLREV
jgi:peptide/nickel transport system permease protein